MSLLTPARGSTSWDTANSALGINTALDQRKKEWDALQQFRDKSEAAQTRKLGEAGSNIANDRDSAQRVIDGDYKDALELARQSALGTTPSVALQQQMAGQEAAQNAQLTQATSATGGQFAQAAAQQRAAQQIGNIASSGAGANEALRAQEMAQGRQQYAQMQDAYQSQLRGLRGQDVEVGLGNQSLNDQSALAWEAMRNENNINNQEWRAKERQSAYGSGQAQRRREDREGEVMDGIAKGTLEGMMLIAGASDERIKKNVAMGGKDSKHLLAQWRGR